LADYLSLHGGTIVVDVDNALLMDRVKYCGGAYVTFGFSEEADFYATHFSNEVLIVD